MLLIDVVDDAVADQVRKISGFEHEDPIGREQTAHSFREVVEIVDVRKDVVGRDDGGRSWSLRSSANAESKNAFTVSRPAAVAFRATSRRIDAEHAHAARLERAKQRAVVAADVDDQGTWGGAGAGKHRLGVRSKWCTSPSEIEVL